MNYEPHEFFAPGASLPRRHRLDHQTFLKEFGEPELPVILTGMTDDWPARRKWNPAYLRETGGSQRVILSQAQNGIHFDADAAIQNPFEPLADYMNMIESGEADRQQLYAGNISVKRQIPELWDDIRFPDYCDGSIPPSLWIGPGGNVVPLHYDSDHNFFTQIRGKKTVLLFAPGEIKNLYPFPFKHRSFYFSRTNVAQPDGELFPRMKRARCHVVHLNEGEILFMPRFWWHAVFGYGFNISLSFWWQPNSSLKFRHLRQRLGFGYRKFQRNLANLKRKFVRRPE